MYHYDAIVIGAGPAGLMAAAELARSNISVAVVEIRRDIRSVKRACSQQIIFDEPYDGDIVSIDSDGFHFQNAGLTVPYNGELVPLYHKYYHSPSDHCLHFSRDDGNTPFSYKFNKSDLIRGLHDECVFLGVKFYSNTNATNVSDNGDSVTVEICRSGMNDSLFCKKLVIAEGVNSNLASKLGMNKERAYMATAMIVKNVYENISGIDPLSWNLYYGLVYHSNAPAIIGPGLKPNTIEVTITSGHAMPLEIMEKFTKNSPVAPIFESARLIGRYGCAVKAWMPMTNPCQDNVIVLGDSAAMIEVEVQGALLCGYYGAQAVVKELEGEEGWSDYTEWWQNSFEFNRDDYMRVSQGYALVPTYTDDELDYLFSLIEDVQFPGTYSQYRTPSLIWDAVFEKSDIIRYETPSLYEKIHNICGVSLNESLMYKR